MKDSNSIIGEQMRLFHGTTEDAARAIIETGFEAPDAHKRVEEIARRYSVDLATLEADKAVSQLLRWRGHQHGVHFATTPGLASSYARRGSEIDYLARQGIYRLQRPKPGGQGRVWTQQADEWARAEVSRSFNPALVEIVVARTDLPAGQLDKIERAEIIHQLFSESTLGSFTGVEVILSAEFSSRWIVGMRLVERCTCWRDGRACSICAAWTASRDGWDGWDGKAELLR
jgi:hypothetical protein